MQKAIKEIEMSLFYNNDKKKLVKIKKNSLYGIQFEKVFFDEVVEGDKDIEEITGNINHTLVEKIENVFKTLYENKNIFPKEFIMNLQYVIDMLVNNQSNTKEMTATRIVVERNIYEMQKLNDERYEKRIKYLKSELETYKKIAEKLADKLMVLDDCCKHIPTEICNEYSNGRCKQCIIDWARKEVKKNEKSNI